MAKTDWGALQEQFLAEYARTGISPKLWCEARGLKYSTAKLHIKIANRNANSQKKSANKTANSQTKNGCDGRRNKALAENCESGESANSPETKPERAARRYVTAAPFQPANNHAIKHGGYGRRLLLSDAITEDAQVLTLGDELLWLRARNLTASESIGRWKTELEVANTEAAKSLHELIASAEKAMHRNTARIESLEYTIASIAKLRVDAAYRAATIEKIEMETITAKGVGKDKESLELTRLELINKKLEAEIEGLANRGNDGTVIVHVGLDVPNGE